MQPDYGQHNNVVVNENSVSPNSNMDTYNDTNDGDEVGSQNEPYTSRIQQDTQRMSSPRPANAPRATAVR